MEILSKPGELENHEFAVIKTHPQHSYSVLKHLDFPWPIAEIALQHHERLDGSGYPRALRGDEIMFKARILAVADVLDAMTVHRPYRAPQGPENALNEIEQGKGKLYDPTVVEAALRLFAAGKILQ